MVNSQVPVMSSIPLAQQRDLRNTSIWRDVENHFQQLHGGAFGKVSGAIDPSASPDGRKIAFTGSIWDKLEGVPSTRICVADVERGTIETITYGPNSDCQARFSPDGRSLAFLSDRTEMGVFQLYLLDLDSLGEARPIGKLDGTVESVSWSPDGTKILLGMAERGADKAGGAGSGTMADRSESQLPSWLPNVEGGISEKPWRRAWIYHNAEDKLVQVGEKGINFWEVVWCGNKDLVAIVSPTPDEGAWYKATLAIIDINTGKERTLYRSSRQMGLPVVSPSATQVAVIEGLYSDRGVIAGEVLVVNIKNGSSSILEAKKVDTTQLIWQNDEKLFFIGLREWDTVAGTIDVKGDQSIKELWTSSETCGDRYPQATLLSEDRFAVVLESWTRYQELALIDKGDVKTIASLEHEGSRYLQTQMGSIEQVSWTAPDGLEIQGYLCLPSTGNKPHPLVLHIHGGPTSAFRNQWSLRYPFVPLLVARGYAVLSPNPRGSKTRGHEFTSHVYGDMGGADAQDLLSGVEAMIDRGIADASRVGVTGGSYGGFMSAWLITQTDRFGAAVPLAPVTDWVSQHTTSNIGYFDRDFLNADPYAKDGPYYHRSPLMFAGRYPTPVLLITGADDRCTPPTQAIQYHNALVEHGVKSVVSVYPNEGHGIRKFPAYIDFCCRLLSWFQEHIPA
ncbi:acylaminoacyl-peptidase [Xylogone sp. PMI_703]|nr:acylaminoacyl-peptidase [Xylogone sp. PMI_703]